MIIINTYASYVADMYCPECGQEIADDSAFCRYCGSGLDTSTDDHTVGEKPQASSETDLSAEGVQDEDNSDQTGLGKYTPTNVKVGVVAFLMAIIVAFAGALALFPIWESGGVILLLFLVAFVYLSQQDFPSESIGVGLYISAIFLLWFPIIFYTNEMATAAGEPGGGLVMIGSIFALLIWGFIGLILAIAVAGIGYLFNRRAQKLAAKEAA